MRKQKPQPTIPALTFPINEGNGSPLPSSEEDRIVVAPTPEPTSSEYIYLKNKKLDLEYYKSLDKNNLKYYFDHNILYNHDIFCQAVEQNEKKLVRDILEIRIELINVKTGLEGYNILHIALLGIADAEMVEILLSQKPQLIKGRDKENLTPLMFGEKYGFGKAEVDRSIEKIKEILEQYERNTIIQNSDTSDTLDFYNGEYSLLSDKNHTIGLSGSDKSSLNTNSEDKSCIIL